MIITPHKYPFAIDDNGKPIYIEDVTNENRRDTHYHCYGCGAELFPVLGDVREHHFRHEKDAICDPNKYLHEYAKAEIKRRFDEEDVFEIQYQVTHRCKFADECEYYAQYDWSECEGKNLKKINLKDFYDTCTAEKGYYQTLPSGKRKYIADLILTNSQKPNTPSVCIEVWVTHECTDDKKLNGGKIIEIKIEKESDAQRPLIETNELSNKPIRFYNFLNRVIETEPSRVFKHIKILPGLLQDQTVVTRDSLCRDGIEYDSEAAFEIIVAQSKLHPQILAAIFASYCSEHGFVYPCGHVCQYSMSKINWKDNNPRLLRCNFTSHRCPCDKYKYSKLKGKTLKNNILPYCPVWCKAEPLN